MTGMPPTPLVPFNEANEETREAYLVGLLRRGLDANPEAWLCAVCGEKTPGDVILISYGVGDTPIPFCTTPSCSGYGPDLTPTVV